MNIIFEKLKQKKILVSDGAWGTMLQSKGLKAGECPEEGNISHPEAVKSIAAAYIEAGADIVLTNSFGGSELKLSGFGYENQTENFNRIAAQLSKNAAKDNKLVFGSVGPSGHFLVPLGTVTEKQMIDNFKIQIKGLSEGGVDAILIETMTDLGEAIAAVKAAQDVCNLPVAVTMTFDKGKQGYRTMMGTTIEQAVNTLVENNVDVLGTNCGNGIEQIVEIIAEFRQYTDKYLIAHPNAGLPRLVKGETIFDQTPNDMAKHVPDLIKAGANIIGGCCGTGPDHIKAIAQKISLFRDK